MSAWPIIYRIIVDTIQLKRLWGRRENRWNDELLNSIEKVLGLAGTMTWKGRNPVVNLITKSYKKGVRLTKKR